MKRRTLHEGTAARGGGTRWSTVGRSARQVPGAILGLSLLGVLCSAGSGVAQIPLTVRPREMATGTRTVGAGEHRLPDWITAGNWLYVPPQCVGTRRCPLFVYSFSAGPEMADPLLPRVADKYGMIVWATRAGGEQFAAELQKILREFAIDPDKIATAGYGGGGIHYYLGDGGIEIFSRVAPISQGGSRPNFTKRDPQSKTEYFIGAGFGETHYNWMNARALRQAGYPVKQVVALRGHIHQVEEFDFLGRWLQQSWATQDPAARPRPEVIADPLPVLTSDALTQMTRFWERFVREPDSIRTTARRAHLREVALSVGDEEVSTVMTDMRALAATYPSVAAALKQAGLTAQQHEAYRVALLSTVAVLFAPSDAIPPIPATSVLGQNLAFLKAHPEAFPAEPNAMVTEPATMWNTP